MDVLRKRLSFIKPDLLQIFPHPSFFPLISAETKVRKKRKKVQTVLLVIQFCYRFHYFENDKQIKH